MAFGKYSPVVPGFNSVLNTQELRTVRGRNESFHLSLEGARSRDSLELSSRTRCEERFPGSPFDPEATNRVATFNVAWGVAPPFTRRSLGITELFERTVSISSSESRSDTDLRHGRGILAFSPIQAHYKLAFSPIQLEE